MGFNFTLAPQDPRNTLGVPADPIVFYHETHGQVLMLYPAPAPDFIPYEDIYNQKVLLYDIEESGLIPAGFYARDNQRSGLVKS